MHFLLADFPSPGTLTTKDYEKADLRKSKEEREESKTDRFAGYQKLCLFGLGSMFWSSVTGVLAEIEKKAEPQWKNWTGYYFIYSAVALLLMLVGLAASTFANSCWFAPSLAGLGALQAVIFVLGAFHIDSLKYHSNVDQCLHFMIGCTVAVIFYWGWSIQDPLVIFLWTTRACQIIPKCIVIWDGVVFDTRYQLLQVRTCKWP
ncbi:hypothetical protein GQ55_J004000 [Panicum hallii var. hallii]|uniref:Uncharacterized protein n=1 Tax=Panicum hallii var. hallii TaxID=1504633 RepID=A0A2T7A9Q3_9POAL|nr:hypothetical protein GQ55_J004000 [Panicum hallii var. hallii]